MESRGSAGKMSLDKLRQILEWSRVLHYSVVTIWFIAYSRHRRG
jgi:hypothetical protein